MSFGTGLRASRANYKSFPTNTTWTAPKGTQQTYKIHQRKDIDWDLVRVNTKGDYKFIGKTKREDALAGRAPELPDGSITQLHHVGQNSKGPLVEVSSRVHNPKNHQAFKALHGQFGGKAHPEFPVDHGPKWRQDTSEYWKWRVKDAIE